MRRNNRVTQWKKDFYFSKSSFLLLFIKIEGEITVKSIIRCEFSPSLNRFLFTRPHLPILFPFFFLIVSFVRKTMTSQIFHYLKTAFFEARLTVINRFRQFKTTGWRERKARKFWKNLKGEKQISLKSRKAIFTFETRL